MLDGQKGSSTCFVLTHGAGTGIEAGGLPEVAAALAGKGHAVIRMDLPYRAAGRKAPPKAEKSVAGFTSALMEAFRISGSKTLIAGGKSYGGRVASMAAAEGAAVHGLVFLGYPLHRPGMPSEPRISHWPDIKVPCLFLQGDRDPFCDLTLLKKNLPLIKRATLEVIEGGDHSLRLRRKGADSTTIIVNAIEIWRKAEGLT
ncbi:MAG TPA: alpha/beta family hydrolase [Actinomycetota bacterium]|nr:alpha/beta family hydrolase [Actinomycetota bacterium]